MPKALCMTRLKVLRNLSLGNKLIALSWMCIKQQRHFLQKSDLG